MSTQSPSPSLGSQIPQLFVHPGQVVASATPGVFITILGTCVSVCLFDAKVRVGGINHFLLPYGVGLEGSAARYGNVAMERLLSEVLALGASKSRLQAKVFGGMTGSLPASNPRNLGASNVAFALQSLEQERIPVVARDVGGERGRKLIFQSQDGTAWVKHF